MKKMGVFNSEIAGVIAKLGHTDMVAVVDLGFPIPENVKRIDLVIDKNKPTVEDVLKVLAKELCVEKLIVAKESSGEFLEMLEEIFQNVEIYRVPHEEFKILSKSCMAIIRTGEAIPYSNVLLVSGVIF